MEETTSLQKCISELLNQDDLQLECSTICSLWAGYGKIERIKIAASHQSFVCKNIKPPINTRLSIGDERKRKSYEVEVSIVCLYLVLSSKRSLVYLLRIFYLHIYKCNFYLSLNTDLKAVLPLPTVFSITKKHCGEIVILMDDLKMSFPIENAGNIRKRDIPAAVKWLAQFHAFGIFLYLALG